jgi:hypothetical protein
MMKMKTTLLTLLACASLSAVNGAIILENSSLNNNQNNAGTTFNVVDETGGNTSSILLVGIGYRVNGPQDTITIDYNGSTGVSGTLIRTDANSDIVTAIWAFDLGNVSSAETININNPSQGSFRETFSIVQLSGASFTPSAHNGNSGDPSSPFVMSTTLTAVNSGDFVFMVGSDRQDRDIDSFVGTFDSSAKTTNSSGYFYGYDVNSAGGDLTVGADWSGDSNKSVSAVAITAIPEPGTFALMGLAGVAALIAARRRRR